MVLFSVVCQYIGEIYLIKQIMPVARRAVLRRGQCHAVL